MYLRKRSSKCAMDRLYLIKQCIMDQAKMNLICSHFSGIEVAVLDDPSDMAPDRAEGRTICLITIEQVEKLNKDAFQRLINNIDYCLYVIILNPGDVQRIKRMMKTGSKGFLLTDDSTDIIIDCIEKTFLYGGYMSPRIMSILNKVVPEIVAALPHLSHRLIEVVLELLKGKSDKMIADALNLSYQTAKTHRKKIYKILNVNSQGELFALFH